MPKINTSLNKNWRKKLRTCTEKGFDTQILPNGYDWGIQISGWRSVRDYVASSVHSALEFDEIVENGDPQEDGNEEITFDDNYYSTRSAIDSSKGLDMLMEREKEIDKMVMKTVINTLQQIVRISVIVNDETSTTENNDEDWPLRAQIFLTQLQSTFSLIPEYIYSGNEDDIRAAFILLKILALRMLTPQLSFDEIKSRKINSGRIHLDNINYHTTRPNRFLTPKKCPSDIIQRVEELIKRRIKGGANILEILDDLESDAVFCANQYAKSMDGVEGSLIREVGEMLEEIYEKPNK
jgi:hypothetical protein